MGKEKSFTLIELLIVWVIIGILASLAVPKYNDFIEQARLAEAISILGAIRKAEKAYQAETGEYKTFEWLKAPNMVPAEEAENWVASYPDDLTPTISANNCFTYACRSSSWGRGPGPPPWSVPDNHYAAWAFRRSHAGVPSPGTGKYKFLYLLMDLENGKLYASWFDEATQLSGGVVEYK